MNTRSLILAGGVVVSALISSAASACTLTVNNGGTLALSMDGYTLGSEQPSGTGAAMLIGSLGAATVQIAAPTLIQTPNGYDGTSDVVSIKYAGLGGLNGVAQDYTDVTTSFSIGLLPLTMLTMNARVINPATFDAGTYRLRTVVTCY